MFKNKVSKIKQHQTKKTQNILPSLPLSDVKIYLRDGPFSSDIGIVNLHLSKGTYWVAYINEIFFDSYGCSPPRKLSRFTIKRNGHSL